MKLPVVFRPQAEDELLEAFDWYESREPGIGEQFLRAVAKTITFIEANPKAAPVVGGRVRARVVQRFPFLIVYAKSGDGIAVLSVFHTKRDPRGIQNLL